jgi:hypothetical protein
MGIPPPGGFCVKTANKGVSGAKCAKISKQGTSRLVDSARCEELVKTEFKGVTGEFCL